MTDPTFPADLTRERDEARVRHAHTEKDACQWAERAAKAERERDEARRDTREVSMFARHVADAGPDAVEAMRARCDWAIRSMPTTRDGDFKQSDCLDAIAALKVESAPVYVACVEARRSAEAKMGTLKEAVRMSNARRDLVHDDRDVALVETMCAEIAALLEALKPFAAIICRVDEADEAKGYAFDTYPDNRHVFAVGKDRVITAGDLRRAHAALAKGSPR